MIQATYDSKAQAYVVRIPDTDAHCLIWGGMKGDLACIERDLRTALVEVEDNEVPDTRYSEILKSIYPDS